MTMGTAGLYKNRMLGYILANKYPKIFLHRILRIKEAGLLSEWENWYVPKKTKCMQINQRDRKIPRISIGHLGSAFVILLAGYVISILVFIIEKMFPVLTLLSASRNINVTNTNDGIIVSPSHSNRPISGKYEQNKRGEEEHKANYEINKIEIE